MYRTQDYPHVAYDNEPYFIDYLSTLTKEHYDDAIYTAANVLLDAYPGIHRSIEKAVEAVKDGDYDTYSCRELAPEISLREYEELLEPYFLVVHHPQERSR